MKWLFSALLVCAIGVIGCSVQAPVAGGGGDDFPNSASAALVGKQLAANFNQYQTWDSSFIVAQSVPPVETGDQIVLAKKTSLAKTSAAAGYDSLRFDFTDTATGIIRMYLSSSHPPFNINDTTVLVWNAQAMDTVTNNETILSKSGVRVNTLLFRQERYRYEDADGDGILTGPATMTSRARVTYTTIAGTIVSRSVVVVDAGSDNNFSTTGDNKTLFSDYYTTSSTDTLERYNLTDADNDSAIIDFTARDSNLVDFHFGTSRVGFKPALVWRTAECRFVLFKDSTQNYPIRYAVHDRFLSGRSVLSRITGSGPNSCFYPGDTAWSEVVVAGTAGDSLIADTVRVTALMGARPKESADDSLLSVYAHIIQQSGLQRDVIVSFVSRYPIARGQPAVAGDFTFTRVDNTGKRVMLQGSFDAVQITATGSDGNGKPFTIIWNRAGTIIQ